MMQRSVPGLEFWRREDLVQEAFLKVLTNFHKFQGRSALKTWVAAVAKRHCLDLARASRAKSAQHPGEDPVWDVPDRFRQDPDYLSMLRTRLRELLGWLKQDPSGVKWGFEVLNLMLNNHGDAQRVALHMSIHTGTPWTFRKVQSVIRQIKRTEHGEELCQSLRLSQTIKIESKE